MALTYQHATSRFESVQELFASYLDGDFDAQLAVYVEGELVIDLAAGISPDAVMSVFSTSKGLAAFALALLVDRAQLDLDELVQTYWPNFGQAGKERVTVRQMLSHQAGIPEVDGGMPSRAWLDDHQAADLLAKQLPFWNPGSGFGYHALSLGSLMGELCFSITGQTLQEFYENEIRSVVGANAFLGLPDSTSAEVVELLPMAEPTVEQQAAATSAASNRGPYGPLVFALDVSVLTSAEGRAFGQPAGGGVASARGLAGIYQWATGYGRSTTGITEGTLAAFAQSQVAGYDMVGDQYRSHGIVFQKPTSRMPFGSYRAFGHDGARGSMAFADPVYEMCFAYTVRRCPFPGGIDFRGLELIQELRRVLSPMPII